jgi:lipopolysaccharide export LptBFGC system permease protein LptF
MEQRQGSKRPGQMVLVAFLLLLAAVAFRVAGVVSDNLGLLYGSIGCAGIAAVTLAVGVWLAKRNGDSS